ncbi:hypothetical protein TcCL_ESM01480 [Trypanosoma cruzi]|nr:hypothetical protein TcCL_ESM01480 [Trypanosoma cruzi]
MLSVASSKRDLGFSTLRRCGPGRRRSGLASARSAVASSALEMDSVMPSMHAARRSRSRRNLLTDRSTEPRWASSGVKLSASSNVDSIRNGDDDVPASNPPWEKEEDGAALCWLPPGASSPTPLSSGFV